MKKKKIKEIIEEWEKEKINEVKISTFSTYSSIIKNHILPRFENQYCFCEDDVQKFILEKTKQNLSIKTLKDILVVIKMIIKFSIKNGYMRYASLDIKLPNQISEKQMNVLSTNEYKKLITYTKQNFTFKNLGILICLSTGMRIGEICALKWEDINIEMGVICVNKTLQRVCLTNNSVKSKVLEMTPKTNSSKRQIPISSGLLKILKPLKRVVNDKFYILTNNLSPIEPRSYRNHYKTILTQLGLKELKFHALRHSFASRCIDAKCDYKTLSSILGHSSVNTTLNIYVHPSHLQKKQCIDKMLKQVM